MGVAVTVTSAAANAVNLVDIGTDADTDGFVDGIFVAINSTGFKGFFPCNGALGMSGGATTAATETPDEVEVVISGTAGAGGVLSLKFFAFHSIHQPLNRRLAGPVKAFNHNQEFLRGCWTSSF